MNKGSAFFCLIFLSILTVAFCKPQDDEEEEDEEVPKDCVHYIAGFVFGILNSTLKCLGGRSTFKMNNIFELATRASCLLKCTLQEEGILSLEDGRLDDIGAAFYFEETFAEQVREISLPEVQSCFALAESFQPKEYWCKTYLPFIECSIRAILKGLIPYGADCVVNPVIGILFSVLKYIAPDSPKVSESMDDLRRMMAKKNQYKCLDANCTRMYEYKKVNGSQAVVLYNKDMEVLSVDTRKSKPKPKSQSQPTTYHYGS
ncbi:unnamed protein product [Orchesella dallaii]|uniref:Uncharacterized protein n=1 Tax=Orchesella dallaii TaxID=48710 RepID=A0ABP1PTZ2_9HEXA